MKLSRRNKIELRKDNLIFFSLVQFKKKIVFSGRGKVGFVKVAC